MEVTTSLPIQYSYRERAPEQSDILPPTLSSSTRIPPRRLGSLISPHALPYRLPNHMATLDVTTDPGGLRESGAELLFVS
jgi:hypothetical protein